MVRSLKTSGELDSSREEYGCEPEEEERQQEKSFENPIEELEFLEDPRVWIWRGDGGAEVKDDSAPKDSWDKCLELRLLDEAEDINRF